jgi:fibronectin-binding autotransporter adhesin
MPIMSPNVLPPDNIPAGATITRIIGPHDVAISLPITGDFAFALDTQITFGPAPERKLNLSGSNSGDNTLASLIQNASDGGLVGLTKSGAGKWIVTGNNSYTGTTNVNAGTLLVNGTQTGAGLTTVAAGATLGGTGRVGGALVNNGTVNPGASVGTLNVGGNVTMGENSHYLVELLGANADRLAITGNLDLSALANSLDVVDLGKTGTSWVIATYTGTLTGTFENITAGYSVDYGTLSNSQVTLNFMDEPELDGDFNDDGVVDAADYAAYRKNHGTNNALPNDGGLGTPITTAHLDLWRANFGETAGAGNGASNASGAVPEPGTCLLAAIALAGMLALRRREQ